MSSICLGVLLLICNEFIFISILIIIGVLFYLLLLENGFRKVKGVYNIKGFISILNNISWEILFIYLLFILTFIVISWGVQLIWVIFILEIQSFLFMGCSAYLSGQGKLSFNEGCLNYLFPAFLSFCASLCGSLCYIMNEGSYFSSSYIWFTIALIIKIGIVPAHIWLPNIYKNISWSGICLLSIINKVGIIVVLIVYLPFNQSLYLYGGCLSMVVTGFLAYNTIIFKEIIAFSGVSNLSWVIIYCSGLTYGNLSTFCEVLSFFLVYSVTLLQFISYCENNNLLTWFEIRRKYGSPSKTNIEGIIWCFILFSLAGMPPMSIFIVKFIFLKGIIIGWNIYIAIVILILSLPLLFTYIRPITILLIELAYIKPYLEENTRKFNNIYLFIENLNLRLYKNIFCNNLIFFNSLFSFFVIYFYFI